jgi:hypothetical protein
MMRFLRILVFVIGAALFSSGALAQAVQPKFSVGFSLGIPSSLHVAVRDIAGVAGLGVRTDIGGFYVVFFSWLHVALNLEYHLGTVEEGGFYFGLGFVVFKKFLDGMEPPMTPLPDQFGWKLGAQVYVGLEGPNFFLEFGLVPIYELTEVGSFAFTPRILLGYRYHF